MTKKLKSDGSVSEIFSFENGSAIEIPLLGTKVSAGFPSPAQDYIEATLDLNQLLIKHPIATYFIKVEGFSMVEAGINPGDLLIVDRALAAENNKIVIAVLDGELTVKRLKITEGMYWLFPENKEYEPIPILEENDFSVWGVVTYVIHKLY